ncbi:prohibitin family protein [Undibacterium sp. MH2W]|uniref:prohibitin family protein n=1 Tax=Undibacterium sp. MH2W TaxID=3413044 RepID=UPI003BF32D36
MTKKLMSIVSLVVTILIALILKNMFVASVSANHVGVEFNRIDGRVVPTPLTSGWHLMGIGTSVVEFPTFTQTYTWTKSVHEGAPLDESMNFQVASGVVINADLSISYSIDSSKAPVLYQKYKRGYEEITSRIIRNEIRNALNIYGSDYDAEGLLSGGKIKLAEQVRQKINSDLGPYGILVEQFGFVNELRLPTNIQQAIDAKIQATQEALKSEAMLRKNKADAANAVAIAQGQADAKIAAAQGDAKALAVLGESIKQYGAEAAKVKNQTLWIEKWDGKLPTTTAGNNAALVMGVNGISESK